MIARPALITSTRPCLALCRCGHEQRRHLSEEGLGFTVCRDAVRRRCPCVRFTEAAFEQQQVPMFGEKA